MFQFEKYACSHDKLTQTHICTNKHTLWGKREKGKEKETIVICISRDKGNNSAQCCLPDTPSKFSFVIKHFYLCYLRCHGLGCTNTDTLDTRLSTTQAPVPVLQLSVRHKLQKDERIRQQLTSRHSTLST